MIQAVDITAIPGVQIGNAQDIEGGTGCTVVLCEKGAVCGVDVRGGAPGTRETDLLKAENLVEAVHAVFLAGGSAFGLDAAGGIMQYLEENGIGFDVGVARVPIVPGAVLFDLPCGNPQVRPDKAMGYRACATAVEGRFFTGSVGAGTGATIGKYFGMEHAMKGGLGAYCLQTGNLMVGAVVAVNCLGDVIDPSTGRIIAGAYGGDGAFLNTEAVMAERAASSANLFAGNTTIGIIITNAALTKANANKIASMAHDGYARTMRPAHTMVDGDTIFTIATGAVPTDLNAVGLLAARAMEKAVLNAVFAATTLGGVKAYCDMDLKSLETFLG